MMLDESNAAVWALIRRAREGSPDALGHLLDVFRPYLIQVAVDEVDSDLRVKEPPSDLVQKTFMEAAHAFANFNGEAPEVMRAWLRQILLNNIQDLREHFRTQKRQLTRELAGAVEGIGPALPADVTPPLDVAIRREQASILEVALGKLAPDVRKLIERRSRDGHSFKDIAAQLRVPEDTVRKRWARAVEELRQLARDESSSRQASSKDIRRHG
jgi:RNA polymerase sigma-70 factor (ECF subfamily)